MIKRRESAISMFLALGLSACTPTRVENPVPDLASPAEWRHAPQTQGQAYPDDLAVWWRGFRDPILDSLIIQALAGNHDLKIAAARIREAEAMTVVSESVLYPQLDLFASGGREKRIERVIGKPSGQGMELFTPTADIITGGLTARWEIDLFGARQLEAEATRSQADGAEETLHAARVSLLAQVATHYLELRGVQARIGLLRENIQLQQQRLTVLRAFKQAGLANQADIAGQETLLRTTESQLPHLGQAEASLTHRLAVLLGEAPENLENRLAVVELLPAHAPDIPRLLPADLLEQRPDLRIAKTEVVAAADRLGAARADRFPKLILSASGGVGALASSGFSSIAEAVYTLGSGLSAPIFNAGRIQAIITAADARLNRVAASYEKTFLLALEDVENAFVAHATSIEFDDRLSQAEVASEQALLSARMLYRQGARDYLAVLDAQRNRLNVGDQHIKARTARRVAIVSLYRAFGGGWINDGKRQ
jgi:NodT family efflux transporter outer membrane factor (OMF) lipoprotein